MTAPKQKSSILDQINQVAMSGELFLPLEGYEKRYYISSYGRVASNWRGWIRIRSLTKSNGYKYFTAKLNGDRRTIKVARAVAKTFLSNPEHLPVVNHIDHDRSNDHVSNLEWCTQSHNIKEAYKRPHKIPYRKGEKSPVAKYNAKTIISTRKIYSSGKLNQSQLARKFKMSQSHIWGIVNGRSWSHI